MLNVISNNTVNQQILLRMQEDEEDEVTSKLIIQRVGDSLVIKERYGTAKIIITEIEELKELKALVDSILFDILL